MKTNANYINYTGTLDYSINPCGGVITGQKITITSPNYPNNFQQTTKCAWSLRLHEENQVNVSIEYWKQLTDSFYTDLH